ncbi:MAG: hypothetical protein Q4C02_05580 [Eubacteriales bacterium]|nr:hypothetical protein [Lachnospiraceae bacterium]MDO4417736.1 hypothetical protein [Eubacteriales bacterium]
MAAEGFYFPEKRITKIGINILIEYRWNRALPCGSYRVCAAIIAPVRHE